MEMNPLLRVAGVKDLRRQLMDLACIPETRLGGAQPLLKFAQLLLGAAKLAAARGEVEFGLARASESDSGREAME
jgi:hypothetical protein